MTDYDTNLMNMNQTANLEHVSFHNMVVEFYNSAECPKILKIEDQKNLIGDEDPTTDMIMVVRAIKVMLDEEAKLWFDSPNSKTADAINTYTIHLCTLLNLLVKKKMKSFLIYLIDQRVDIDQIRICFRGKRSTDTEMTKNRRHRSRRLFLQLCQRVLSLVRTEEFERYAKSVDLDIKDVVEFVKKNQEEGKKDEQKDPGSEGPSPMYS